MNQSSTPSKSSSAPTKKSLGTTAIATANTSSTTRTAGSTSNQYESQLLNYEIHEVYLRPLLDKHHKLRYLCHEDLIRSWNRVEQWQRQRQQQRQKSKAVATAETMIESQIVAKVETLHKSLVQEYTKQAQLYYKGYIDSYSYSWKNNIKNNHDHDSSTTSDKQTKQQQLHVQDEMKRTAAKMKEVIDAEIKRIEHSKDVQNWILTESVKESLFYQPLREKIMLSLRAHIHVDANTNFKATVTATTTAAKINTNSDVNGGDKGNISSSKVGGVTSNSGDSEKEIQSSAPSLAISNDGAVNANTTKNANVHAKKETVGRKNINNGSSTNNDTLKKKDSDPKQSLLQPKLEAKKEVEAHAGPSSSLVTVAKKTSKSDDTPKDNNNGIKNTETGVAVTKGKDEHVPVENKNEQGIKNVQQEDTKAEVENKKEVLTTVIDGSENEDEVGETEEEDLPVDVDDDDVDADEDEGQENDNDDSIGDNEGDEEIDDDNGDGQEDDGEEEEGEIGNLDNEGGEEATKATKKNDTMKGKKRQPQKRRQQQQQNTKSKTQAKKPTRKTLQNVSLSTTRQGAKQQQQKNKRKQATAGGGGGRGRKSARIENRRTSGGRGRRNRGST